MSSIITAIYPQLPPHLVADLERRYTERHRYYHNLDHLHAMGQGYIDAMGETIEPTTALAILYHDAIYDPTRSDNEAQSAALWQQHASEIPGITHDRIERVRAYIEATALHPYSEWHATHSETDGYLKGLPLFLDCDLPGLASDPATFMRNSRNIRQEYAHVPDEVYIEGRRAFLQKMLDARLIFISRLYQPANHTAKINLAWAIELLPEMGVSLL